MQFMVKAYDGEGMLDKRMAHEPYVCGGVRQRIEVETMNVVPVNGEKRV